MRLAEKIKTSTSRRSYTSVQSQNNKMYTKKVKKTCVHTKRIFVSVSTISYITLAFLLLLYNTPYTTSSRNSENRRQHVINRTNKHNGSRHRSKHHTSNTNNEGNLYTEVSSLREHHSSALCTDPCSGGVVNSHRVEKRSYLPPVICTTFHEENAVRSKVHCQPRPRVIRLPWPNDTSVQQMQPSHIEVNRCDGSCHHQKQSCLPKRMRKKKVPVILAQCSIHNVKCDKICAEVEVEEHTECGCECQVKRHHCNSKQVYREELCGCQCRDLSEVRACHESGRVWDPTMCMCRCPLSTLQQCSSKFVFDFTNSCKCIPEENNEISGKRTERGAQGKSKPIGWTSWEILTIGGLAVACVCLSLLAASLARYNFRLKQRLRSSAEVLVPQSGVTIIPALS